MQNYTSATELQKQMPLFRQKQSPRSFTFDFPLKHKVVRDLKIAVEYVGDLKVEAVGYCNTAEHRIDIFDRYSVDIDFVFWDFCNIKPVLEVTGGLAEITEAAVRHFAALCEKEGGL